MECHWHDYKCGVILIDKERHLMTENDGEMVGLLQYYIYILNDNQSFPLKIDQNIEEGVLMYSGAWNILNSLF